MKPRKDLLTIGDLSDEDINTILDSATAMKDIFTKSVKKVPALKGKSVLTLFYEPSTRTRSSFEVAAHRLSADVTTFTVSTSSVVKGESVHDTIDTLMSMKMDYIIVRHKNSGIPAVIARHCKAAVINAGDGSHAHPSQAFLDAFTIREKYGTVAG
ncbi:MAG: aspartate carbamoyltransferase, partial [Akkermansia sp.]|nr:aspartate carbamoyltransferase [Akkermansia sp.]